VFLKGEDFMRTAIICGALMALTVTTAAAAEKDMSSANFFLPHCKVSLDPKARDYSFVSGVCAGSVSGLVFALATLTPGTLCIPAAANTSQMVRVVIRYVETRPQRMHEPFESLALEALRDAWPCKK